MFKYLSTYHYIPFAFLFAISLSVSGQEKQPADSIAVKKDFLAKDSLRKDSMSLKKKDQPFKSKVSYNSDDSIHFSLNDKMIYLFKNSKVTYEDIELTSERVDFNMEKSAVSAYGVNDSTGEYIGKPNFKQSNEKFQAKRLAYNFKSRKAIVSDIISEQEGGFLHAEKTKKQPNGQIDLIHGKYTTCDAEHPHFYLALTKAVVDPGNVIVSGPAYVVMEDIPLPIGIPFGFFPSKKNSTSGVLIPTYGEEASRGFFLRNGGYYFALSDYFDLRLTGDIYSKGTWGLSAASSYTKRYKFRGSFSGNYMRNIFGDEGNQTKSTDFRITWNHSQDSKANPYQSFSANVNFSSTSYDRNHSYTNPSQFLQNVKQSSISYNKQWPNNSPFNLSLNLNHSQDSRSKEVNLSLPTGSFNISRIYLFRGKNSSGGDKWYDNFSLSYSSSFMNTVRVKEDNLFKGSIKDSMVYGFQHSIPFGTTFKLWKTFNLNLSPSLNYTGVVNSFYVRKTERSYVDTAGKTVYYLDTDTVHKLSYAHGFSPSVSLSIGPTWYGNFGFKSKKFVIQQIRHVFRPTASVSLVPDLRDLVPNYSRTVLDENGNPYTDNTGRTYEYSMYEGAKYGAPSSASRKSGTLSLSAYNNLEMKVRSKSDTITGLKKIKLIENLNIGTSYNIFADSMRWSNISISGNTALTEKLRLDFNANMDPYSYKLNSKGLPERTSTTEFKRNGKIGRLTNFGFRTSYSFQSGQGKNKKESESASPGGPKKPGVVEEYDYFDIPWNFSFDYSFNYSKSNPFEKSQIIQTLSFNGGLSLTPKWKIHATSGFDFKTKDFTYTTIGLDRDLHCWAMTFSCSPFGTVKFYSFSINVKSAILKDLKYDKHKSIYDYQQY